MSVFQIDRLTPEAVAFTAMIAGQASEIRHAIISLKGANAPAVIDAAAIKIHELENEADDLLHRCLASLFAGTGGAPSAFEVIKKKEIYEYLETTTDKAEDVADVLRSLLIKYSL